MDTKLKSFNYSYGAKIIALLLVFSLAFSGAYSLFTLFRSEIIFADDENRGFISTPAFLNNISDDALSIQKYTTFDEELVNSYSLFCAKDYCTRTSVEALKKDEAKALQLFDIITEFKKLAPAQTAAPSTEDKEDAEGIGEIADVTANEDVTAPQNAYDSGASVTDVSVTQVYIYDTDEWYSNASVSDPNGNYNRYLSSSVYSYKEVSSVSAEDAKTYLNKTYTDYNEWQNDYAYLRSQIFSLVTDATSRDTITLEFENKISTYSQGNWNSYVSDYLNSVVEFTNLKYAAVDNTTGNIRTNFEDGEFDYDKFEPNLPTGMFHVCYKPGVGLISGGCTVDNENADAVIELLGGITSTPTAEEFNTTFLDSYFGSNNISLYLYIGNDLVKGDAYHYLNQNYLDIHGKKTFPLAAAALLLLSSVLPFIFLCTVCGRRSDNTLAIAAVDKVPFIFHLTFSVAVISGLAMLLGIFAVFEFSNDYYQSGVYSVMRLVYSAMPYAFAAVMGLMTLAFTELILSVVRLVKCKCFFRHTLLYHIINLIRRIVLSILSFFRILGSNRRLTRSAALCLIAFFAVNSVLVAITAWSIDSFGIVFLFGLLTVTFNIASFAFAARYIRAFDSISELAHQMQQGNFDVPFDTESVPKPMRPLAVDVLRIRSSIKVAVDEALKGERMKTELITNVSHDLKTPLTSIITYVDLLKKCSIDNDDAKKYLDVLDDKSKRLKRLIEDLVEASKASTGNVKINAVPIDLFELAVQAMGEHNDALADAGLDAVINSPEVHPVVFADSQHTWRVIDNLFSNAKKYAMPGTRVYVDVTSDGTNGVFSMKNISREALNIPASELTARFVRGDSSRTGEGSGLGLSIAQSLCELQHGVFSLEIDGDLFKATVKLPLYEKESGEENNDTVSA